MKKLLVLLLGCCAGVAHAEVIKADEPQPGIAREIGYVAAADGNRLAYTVYRPAKQQRYPTIVWYDVYGAGSMPPLPFVLNWVRYGYAFAAASARGTGCSDGRYTPFDDQDARDAAGFVDWAGEQKWSTGKVGTAGNSQPGILQFGIAAHHPKHLVAIAPGGTIGRIYADGWYLGGIYNASFAAHWSRIDQPGASRALAQQRVQAGDDACKAAAARTGPNDLLAHLAAEPFDGAYYQQASPWDRAPEVTVPTLMVQSWTDPAVGSSALNVFARVGAKHKRLFVLSGGHDAYHDSTAVDEQLRWMDRWLKGEKNGIEKEPRVRVDFQTVPTAPAQYGDMMPVQAGWTQRLADWPAPDTQWQTAYLTADGKLSPDTPREKTAGTREYFYPSGTELASDNIAFAMKALDWGSLSYRGAPAAQDIAILGAPQVTLYASSAQTGTDLMVNLHDVAPNGDVTFVQRGYLRASRRAVDQARSTPQYVFHPHDRDEPLVPGQVYELRLSLAPVAYVLRAGHALEVLIAAPSPVPSPGWGLIPLMLPGFNTVYHDAAHPSQLRVPVVPGVKAQAPEPACGSLPFQPCRKGGEKL